MRFSSFMSYLELRESPLYRYLIKRSLNIKTIFAATVYTLIMGGIWAARFLGMTGRELFWITVASWALSEFLVCWMVADNIFATIGRMNRNGMATELKLSVLTPRQLTLPLALTTSVLVSICPVVLTVFFEWLSSYQRVFTPVGWSGLIPALDVSGWQYYVILTINLIATALIASCETLHASVSHTNYRSEYRWFSALLRIAVGLLLLVMGMFFLFLGTDFCVDTFPEYRLDEIWFWLLSISILAVICVILFRFWKLIAKRDNSYLIPMKLYLLSFLWVLILKVFFVSVLMIYLRSGYGFEVNVGETVQLLGDIYDLPTYKPNLVLLYTLIFLVPLKIWWIRKAALQADEAFGKWKEAQE